MKLAAKMLRRDGALGEPATGVLLDSGSRVGRDGSAPGRVRATVRADPETLRRPQPPTAVIVVTSAWLGLPNRVARPAERCRVVSCPAAAPSIGRRAPTRTT